MGVHLTSQITIRLYNPICSACRPFGKYINMLHLHLVFPNITRVTCSVSASRQNPKSTTICSLYPRMIYNNHRVTCITSAVDRVCADCSMGRYHRRRVNNEALDMHMVHRRNDVENMYRRKAVMNSWMWFLTPLHDQFTTFLGKEKSAYTVSGAN